MDYTLNDNEIIYLINEDNDYYRYVLFQKYKPIIISIVKDYYQKYNGLSILEYDDLLQEGMIGFNNAINSYNSNNSRQNSHWNYSNKRIKSKVASIQ